MILLDTNVFSALMRADPDLAVIAWLDNQPQSSIWTTSITLMEIHYGLQALPFGKRRDRIRKALDAVLRDEIQDRYASFDAAVAERAADLMALRKSKGRPVDLRDTMIAAIALSTRATIATRNVDHFTDLDVPVINPWHS
jgi:toxin FitB